MDDGSGMKKEATVEDIIKTIEDLTRIHWQCWCVTTLIMSSLMSKKILGEWYFSVICLQKNPILSCFIQRPQLVQYSVFKLCH